MPKFRKKPVVVDAIQYTGSNADEIFEYTNRTSKPESGSTALIIPTLEGQHIASVGDWIIKGVQGECYPCKPDVFAMTYEAVE